MFFDFNTQAPRHSLPVLELPSTGGGWFAAEHKCADATPSASGLAEGLSGRGDAPCQPLGLGTGGHQCVWPRRQSAWI